MENMESFNEERPHYPPIRPLSVEEEKLSVDAMQNMRMIFDCIESQNIEMLERLLRLMPLDSLEAEIQDKYIKILVGHCIPDGDIAMRAIVNFWSEIYPEGQRVPLFVMFCKNRFFTPKEIWFVLRSIGHTDFVEFIDGLGEGEDSNENDTLLWKLYEAFNPSREVLEEAIKRVSPEQLDNQMIYRYLRSKIIGKNPYAKIPEWVQNFAGDELPTEDDLLEVLGGETFVRLPDRSNTLDMIEDTFAMMEENSVVLYPGDRERAIRGMKLRADVCDAADYQELFFEYYPEVEEDPDGEWFIRIFGPSNPFEDEESWMFLSLDEDEVGDEDEWFTGGCERCLSQIREYWHAVRSPIVGGDWEGCFCSWDCVKKSYEDPNDERFILVNAFENQMKRIGIQDRIKTGGLVN